MPAKPSLVVNSSPLIALVAALPDFDTLARIVDRFIIPAEVIAELAAGGLKDDTAARVQTAGWCEVRRNDVSLTSSQINQLGLGEAAVLQTALNENLPAVVIDEIRGRRAARLSGLSVIGSLGLLVELHHAGLLSSMEDAISRMRAKGIYLAVATIRLALDAARSPRR